MLNFKASDVLGFHGVAPFLSGSKFQSRQQSVFLGFPVVFGQLDAGVHFRAVRLGEEVEHLPAVGFVGVLLLLDFGAIAVCKPQEIGLLRHGVFLSAHVRAVDSGASIFHRVAVLVHRAVLERGVSDGAVGVAAVVPQVHRGVLVELFQVGDEVADGHGVPDLVNAVPFAAAFDV